MGEKAIGKYWDKQIDLCVRSRWWDSSSIIRHYNHRICGEYLEGWNAGPVRVLKTISGSARTFDCAVSIGCGTGTKEMFFLEQGIVKKFICYELSEQRVRLGEKIAEEKGMSDSIEFHIGNFFESEFNEEERFDLVFWDNSIHHMLDTRNAVLVSKRILKHGGIFFCNDFVGANRFQWSDLELSIINGVRLSLPEELFHVNEKVIKRFVNRPDLELMKQTDYSEAADSENIIPAVKELFSEPLIIYTGGLIYHTCLNDILQNIPEDSELLYRLLRIDEDAADHGLGQYAFILAGKE